MYEFVGSLGWESWCNLKRYDRRDYMNCRGVFIEEIEGLVLI